MPDRVYEHGRANPSRTARRAAVFAAFMWVLTLSTAVADQAVAPAIEGEFQIGTDGRLMLVPVRVNNRDVLCLVDTGASLTAFDVSLRDVLGEPAGLRVLNAPGARVRVESYEWPAVTIGGRLLKSPRPVVAIDLEDMRRASNAKIYGVIGMDVLQSCRVQIDFDRGRLRFLNSLPRNPAELGEKLPLRMEEDGVPYLRGSLGGGLDEWFVIDTRALGNSLQEDVFDELRERKQLQLGASSASMTVAGEMRGDRGKIREFRMGRFRHAGLRFSRVRMSSLGLRYFSRFRVVFDFPGEALYVREGEHYERPEPVATSGLALKWIEGAATVAAVTKNGAGAKAGMKPDDVLVRIDGRPADVFDPFALRELLTSAAGRSVPVTIRRGKRTFDIELVLDDDRELPP